MYKSTFALGLLSSFVACFPIVTACGQETIREEKTVPVRVEHERTRERDRHARVTPTPVPVCVGRQCQTSCHGKGCTATIHRPFKPLPAPVATCDSPYDDVCSQPAPKPRMVVLYDCTCSRMFDSNIESKCTIGEDGKVQPGNSGGIAVVFDTCWLR